MNSTSVRARLLIALLMIAGSFSVALVGGSATAAPAYTINLTVSNIRPDVGEAVRLTGKVKPAAPGAKVKVQGKAEGTGWVTLSSPVLTKNSTYKASIRFNHAGRIAIRVVKPATRGSAQGATRVRYLRVGDRLQPPVITTTTLPPAAIGAAYTATVETADARPGAFTIGSGSLPAGLSLDNQTGVISGTPTTLGTSQFTVNFRDPDGLSDSQALSLSVVPSVQAPVISTTTLPNGTIGAAYTATMQTVGNKTGTWSVTAGTLPPGTTGNPTTGVISGTPYVQGTFSFTAKFVETATGQSDTQALSITIAPVGPPVISTTTLPGGAVGTSYTATMQTQGNKVGTWTITSGALPAGLTGNPSTGVISGTPTAAGTASFTAKFTETATGLTDSQALSIAIAAAPAPSISTTSLPAGSVGKAYSATLQTVGNRTGTWSKTAGSFPAGLVLNPSTGVISGTPTMAISTTFTIRFQQTGGLSDSKSLSITIDPSTAPVISTTSLPAGEVGVAYTATLQTTGNRTGTWSVSSGSLPNQLSLNSATGVISGTPNTAATSSFTVVFTTTGGLTDSQALSIVVSGASAPVIATTSLPAGTVGNAYSANLATVGNKAGTWSVSTGSLPAGLSLSGAGAITGSPSTAGSVTFTVVFTATNGLTDSQQLTILVEPNSPPVIATTSLPNGTVGTAYSQTLQTQGNRAGSWQVSSGALPAGLNLNGAIGTISGTPTTVSSSSFTVLFTAVGGLTDSGALSIQVVAAP